MMPTVFTAFRIRTSLRRFRWQQYTNKGLTRQEKTHGISISRVFFHARAGSGGSAAEGAACSSKTESVPK